MDAIALQGKTIIQVGVETPIEDRETSLSWTTCFFEKSLPDWSSTHFSWLVSEEDTHNFLISPCDIDRHRPAGEDIIGSICEHTSDLPKHLVILGMS